MARKSTSGRTSSSPVHPAAAEVATAVDRVDDAVLATARRFTEAEAHFHRIEAETRALRAAGEVEDSKAVRLRAMAIRDAASTALKDGVSPPIAQLLRSIEQRAAELSKAASSRGGVDQRLAKIESSITNLRALVATLPELAAVLGVSLAEAPVEPAPVDAVLPAPTDVPEKSVSYTARNRIVRRDLESGAPPRHEVVVDSSASVQLKDVENVGKVRLRVVAADGKPVSLATVQIVGDLGGGGEAILAHGGTTKSGYASFDLTPYDDAMVIRLRVRIPTTDGNSVEKDITDPHRKVARDAGTPHVMVLADSARSIVIPSAASTIDNPDEADAANAPEEYQFDTHMDAGSCCMRPSSHVPARQFFARQIVRIVAPKLVTLKGPFARVPVQAPVVFLGESPSTYAILAGEIVLGRAVTYRQSWRPIRHGLGRLLYSLPLAPREQVKLAIIDWRRRESAMRRESTQERESLTFDQHRDRAVDETVRSVLEEEQSGSSATGSGGGGFSLFGIISIGGGGGGSSSSSEGYRSLIGSTRQRIADNTSQRAASLRSLQSTVVTVASQQEQESIRTRIVQNHNINHAMTLHYYEVLAHYRVVTDVHEEKDVVLIPYAIDAAIFDTVPSFEKFRIAPSRPITRFLLRHRHILDALLPERFDSVFESLTRLVLAADVYKIKPKATVSRWTVELEQSYRTGVRLFVTTTDGQTVPLRPEGGSSTSTFSSDPVDVSEISALRVVFSPSEAVGATVFPSIFGGLAEALTLAAQFKLSRVSVQVRTDRSQFVPVPRNFAIGAAAVNTTLDAGNTSASVALTLSAATLDSMFEDWNSQAHKDYALLQELIAEIQSNPMRYMRAIWLSEDPDRRAIRLDRFLFNGRPLLDQIENRPVGTLGNMVAFPLLEAHKLVPSTNPHLEVSSRFVSLPTRGVFAEVFLSCCNATEVRDPTRVIDLDALRQLSAPDIEGVTPGSRYQAIDTKPSGFPAPIVNIQGTGNLPDPSGLGKSLELLGTAGLFKDMSGLDKLSDSVKATVENAFKDLDSYRKAQAEILKALFAAGADLGKAGLDAAGKVLPSLVGGAAAGVAGAAAGSVAGPAGTAAGGVAGGIGGAAGAALPMLFASTAVDPAVAASAAHLARESNPRALYDTQFLARKAVDDGLISKEQGAQVVTALLGGTQAAAFVPAAFVGAGSGMPDEPALRPCCQAGINGVLDPSALGTHVYGGGASEGIGFLYTDKGGLIDIAHARHCADMTGFLAFHAARLLGTGGSIATIHTSVGLYDGPWTLNFTALNQSPDPDLCIRIAQRVAYELGVWHEIRTFWDSQEFSSFSPEDNFSNLVGTFVAADALRDPRPFDVAMTALLSSKLTALGAKPRADTVTFMNGVTTNPGRWFETGLVFDRAVRRHFGALGTVVPWLAKGAIAPAGLAVPDHDAVGVALSAYYTLTIDATRSGIPAVDYPGGAPRAITPSDFPHFIARARAQFLAAGGADTP
ncbi:MAG: DUF4056 domain-containing protein [Planctomycetes bacterium]|nr:DUF4056 domain-containing protein [Planctomycetota bacterium]MCC7172272.1 DUF4056 domain-containing protein [Planctomycetota bacterium]